MSHASIVSYVRDRNGRITEVRVFDRERMEVNIYCPLARHDADAAPVTLPGAALHVMRGGDLAVVPMTATLNGAAAAVTQHPSESVAPPPEAA